jgi:hypothetical protein
MSVPQNAAPPGDGGRMARLVGSTTDLAVDTPRSRFDRALRWVPRVLSSKPHVIALMGLGIYLIVLPIAGVHVSATSELIGGNYTNVTSDIGACIAAGGTLSLVRQNRRRHRIEEERLMLARQTHRLLHYVYRDIAAELGHVPPPTGQPASGPPPRGGPPPGGEAPGPGAAAP